MKKLLLLILGVVASSQVFAATVNANLNIQGSLATTCDASFTAGTTTLTALVAGTPATGTNTFRINCTPGISTLTISSTSANGWRIRHNTDSNSLISYTLAQTGAPAGFSTTWSGSAGQTAPMTVLSVPPSFNGTPIDIPVTITTQDVPAASTGGNYSDIVTLSVEF